MRILKFIVYGQKVKKDKTCDFTNIVPGTKGYLRADFTFSEEWDDCAKAAVFCCGKEEYPTAIVDGGCIIPSEALTKLSFDVRVVGEKNGYKICTGKEEVRQNG